MANSVQWDLVADKTAVDRLQANTMKVYGYGDRRISQQRYGQ